MMTTETGDHWRQTTATGLPFIVGRSGSDGCQTDGSRQSVDRRTEEAEIDKMTNPSFPDHQQSSQQSAGEEELKDFN